MEKKLQVESKNLRLMVFESALELGKSVDTFLLDKHNIDKDKYTFMLPIKENWFEDGHLKVEIENTVRGKDIFLLTDVGNYSKEYKMHGIKNHTSPNDLMIELLDGIGACNGHAKRLNIVMPLLYAGRQHRRVTRENLLCGQILNIIDDMRKVESFITFDSHDQGVEHAMHNTEFDNFYATNVILNSFIKDLDKEQLKRLAFIAPDNGAVGRRNVYLNCFNYNQIDRVAGSFYKQRDYNNFTDGKYPVIAHEYSGDNDLEGRTAIVVDDMISSGGSMFDVVEELHKRKVGSTYLIVTYALFTKGADKFQEYYDKGMLNGVYTTNLSYIPNEYKEKDWLHVCDCSSLVGNIIYNIHNYESISNILRNKSEPVKLLEKKFNEITNN